MTFENGRCVDGSSARGAPPMCLVVAPRGGAVAPRRSCRGSDTTREARVQERGEALVQRVGPVDPDARGKGADDSSVAEVDADVRSTAVDHEIADASATATGQPALGEVAVERRSRSVAAATDAGQLAGLPEGVGHEAGAIERVWAGRPVAPRIAELGPRDGDDARCRARRRHWLGVGRHGDGRERDGQGGDERGGHQADGERADAPVGRSKHVAPSCQDDRVRHATALDGPDHGVQERGAARGRRQAEGLKGSGGGGSEASDGRREADRGAAVFGCWVPSASRAGVAVGRRRLPGLAAGRECSPGSRSMPATAYPVPVRCQDSAPRGDSGGGVGRADDRHRGGGPGRRAGGGQPAQGRLRRSDRHVRATRPSHPMSGRRSPRTTCAGPRVATRSASKRPMPGPPMASSSSWRRRSRRSTSARARWSPRTDVDGASGDSSGDRQQGTVTARAWSRPAGRLHVADVRPGGRHPRRRPGGGGGGGRRWRLDRRRGGRLAATARRGRDHDHQRLTAPRAGPRAADRCCLP